MCVCVGGFGGGGGGVVISGCKQQLKVHGSGGSEFCLDITYSQGSLALCTRLSWVKWGSTPLL